MTAEVIDLEVWRARREARAARNLLELPEVVPISLAEMRELERHVGPVLERDPELRRLLERWDY